MGGMTYLGHWNGFPTVSALICMITYWIRLAILNHDINPSNSNDSPIYYST